MDQLLDRHRYSSYVLRILGSKLICSCTFHKYNKTVDLSSKGKYKNLLRQVWCFELLGKNKIRATNRRVFPVILYSFGLVKEAANGSFLYFGLKTTGPSNCSSHGMKNTYFCFL